MDLPPVKALDLSYETPAEKEISSGDTTSFSMYEGHEDELLCPIVTRSATAVDEQEIRAYKLGKGKYLYNQIEVVLRETDGSTLLPQLAISEAVEVPLCDDVDEWLSGSCLRYNLQLVDGQHLRLYVFLVYANPHGVTSSKNESPEHHWVTVTRTHCQKGCSGPVLRGLQRFGRLAKRGAASSPDSREGWKEPRNLYVAIDEGSNHLRRCCGTTKFRLLIAVYTESQELLGSAVSSSLRVLANNDAPDGSASFQVHCNIKGFPHNQSTFEGGCRADSKVAPTPPQQPKRTVTTVLQGDAVTSSQMVGTPVLPRNSPSNPGTVSPPVDAPQPYPRGSPRPVPAEEQQLMVLPEEFDGNVSPLATGSSPSAISDRPTQASEDSPHISHDASGESPDCTTSSQERIDRTPMNGSANGAEGNENQLSPHALVAQDSGCNRGGAEDKDPYVRKDHSLSTLCQRFFEAYASRAGAIIQLEAIAEKLGVRKRRIYDIVNVLESVQVVRRRGKNEYIWLGSEKVSEALQKLKETAQEMKQGRGGGSSPTEVLKPDRHGDASEVSPHLVTVGDAQNTTGSESAPRRRRRSSSKGAAGGGVNDTDGKRDKSLRALSEKFVQIFLLHEDKPVPWEYAVEAVLEVVCDTQNLQTKARRLYDVANILTALHLMEKTVQSASPYAAAMKPIYRFLGAVGVEEHLCQVAAASSRQLVQWQTLKARNAPQSTGCPPSNKKLTPVKRNREDGPLSKAGNKQAGSSGGGSQARKPAPLPSPEFQEAFLSKITLAIDSPMDDVSDCKNANARAAVHEQQRAYLERIPLQPLQNLDRTPSLATKLTRSAADRKGGGKIGRQKGTRSETERVKRSKVDLQSVPLHQRGSTGFAYKWVIGHGRPANQSREESETLHTDAEKTRWGGRGLRGLPSKSSLTVRQETQRLALPTSHSDNKENRNQSPESSYPMRLEQVREDARGLACDNASARTRGTACSGSGARGDDSALCQGREESPADGCPGRQPEDLPAGGEASAVAINTLGHSGHKEDKQAPSSPSARPDCRCACQCGQGGDLVSPLCAPPTVPEAFNPLHLLPGLFTPQQLAQLQFENPAFISYYMEYSRALYQLYGASVVQAPEASAPGGPAAGTPPSFQPQAAHWERPADRGPARPQPVHASTGQGEEKHGGFVPASSLGFAPYKSRSRGKRGILQQVKDPGRPAGFAESEENRLKESRGEEIRGTRKLMIDFAGVGKRGRSGPATESGNEKGDTHCGAIQQDTGHTSPLPVPSHAGTALSSEPSPSHLMMFSSSSSPLLTPHPSCTTPMSSPWPPSSETATRATAEDPAPGGLPRSNEHPTTPCSSQPLPSHSMPFSTTVASVAGLSPGHVACLQGLVALTKDQSHPGIEMMEEVEAGPPGQQSSQVPLGARQLEVPPLKLTGSPVQTPLRGTHCPPTSERYPDPCKTSTALAIDGSTRT